MAPIDLGSLIEPVTLTAQAQGAVLVHSRSHADEAQIADYAANYPGATRRASGSSIKFCLVAEGEADVYPRLGTTMEWDTGAAHAVLNAAGGSVTTLDGVPLSYRKPQFCNPHFVAQGSRS
jgi:3'(2'), 5'-bisphosphate nucleotidase